MHELCSMSSQEIEECGCIVCKNCCEYRGRITNGKGIYTSLDQPPPSMVIKGFHVSGGDAS